MGHIVASGKRLDHSLAAGSANRNTLRHIAVWNKVDQDRQPSAGDRNIVRASGKYLGHKVSCVFK